MPAVPADYLTPTWPVAPGVRAVCTTRVGGVSSGPFASFNLGDHVGDAPGDVAANRARLAHDLTLPGPVRWLRQVHGAEVAQGPQLAGNPVADASVTNRPGEVLAILTADCLPVLLADRHGRRVGAAHAGWRSLSGGVLEATVARLGTDPAELTAWLGPAISARAYEIDAQVRDAFMQDDCRAGAAFEATRPGHWRADLYLLARQRLAAIGVTEVFGGGHCTAGDSERFFSFRRDGECGRMASLIWIEPSPAHTG